MNLLQKTVLAVTLVAVVHVPSAFAQSFEPFVGIWAGKASGTIQSGKEKLHCSANNRLKGTNIHMTIRCGESIRISAIVQEQAGKLSGTWSSSPVSGTLAGVRYGNTIRLHIQSYVFQAQVNIERRGNSLYVSLVRDGASSLSVAMMR